MLTTTIICDACNTELTGDSNFVELSPGSGEVAHVCKTCQQAWLSTLRQTRDIARPAATATSTLLTGQQLSTTPSAVAQPARSSSPGTAATVPSTPLSTETPTALPAATVNTDPTTLSTSDARRAIVQILSKLWKVRTSLIKLSSKRFQAQARDFVQQALHTKAANRIKACPTAGGKSRSMTQLIKQACDSPDGNVFTVKRDDGIEGLVTLDITRSGENVIFILLYEWTSTTVAREGAFKVPTIKTDEARIKATTFLRIAGVLVWNRRQPSLCAAAAKEGMRTYSQSLSPVELANLLQQEHEEFASLRDLTSDLRGLEVGKNVSNALAVTPVNLDFGPGSAGTVNLTAVRRKAEGASDLESVYTFTYTVPASVNPPVAG